MTNDQPGENTEENKNNEEINEQPTPTEEIVTPSTSSTTDEDPELSRKKGLVIVDILKLVVSLKNYLGHVLNLKEGADIPGTVEGIKKDIDFTGHKAWILILSIFIASIGLNVNSTAVIIGAMLISPLMGPILGAGLAVGVNDPETFSRSIRNLATAVGISLAASTLYFLISPFDTPDSELLARTKPTILDVLIAFFGGAAGIIAGSRSEKSNVIPGVAIATALMPPLCTAGFGLANLKFDFFFGAFYLFLLNSIFIWLATYLVVRFINFPKVKFINPEREKKYKRYIVISILIIILPSTYIFWGVLQETYFKGRAQKYISENIDFESSTLIKSNLNFSEDEKSIDLYIIGVPLSEERQRELIAKLGQYNLEDTKVNFHQSGSDPNLQKENQLVFMESLYKNKEEQIFKQDSIIRSLETRITKFEGDTLPLNNLQRELQVIYPNIEKFSYAKFIETDFSTNRDTIPTFLVVWSPDTEIAQRAIDASKLEKWLQARLNEEKIQVIAY